MFNESLTHGVFPMLWKLSHLTPIFKSGSRTSVENNRGVSILPCIPKLFESMVTDVVSQKLTMLIIPQQHGFVSGRSCATNLVYFTSTLARHMEEGYQIDVIYTDFKKAFDKVPIGILLRTFESYGIDGQLLR